MEEGVEAGGQRRLGEGRGRNGHDPKKEGDEGCQAMHICEMI
jgi:hypothetical protein